MHGGILLLQFVRWFVTSCVGAFGGSFLWKSFKSWKFPRDQNFGFEKKDTIFWGFGLEKGRFLTPLIIPKIPLKNPRVQGTSNGTSSSQNSPHFSCVRIIPIRYGIIIKSPT